MNTHVVSNFPNVSSGKVALVQGVLSSENGKTVITQAVKVSEFPLVPGVEAITVDRIITKN